MTTDPDPSTHTAHYPDGLSAHDTELWDAAASVLRRAYRSGRHEVAAAIRVRSGDIHVGVHVAGSAGRSSLCAEGVALGATLAAIPSDRTLADEIDTVLSLLHRPGIGLRIVSACGVCRDLLVDYCPDAWNYIHHFPTATSDSRESEPSTLYTPEPVRGIVGAPGLAPGSAGRVRVRDLMPGKNIRSW